MSVGGLPGASGLSPSAASWSTSRLQGPREDRIVAFDLAGTGSSLQKESLPGARDKEAPGKASATEQRVVELEQEAVAWQTCSAAWRAKPSVVRLPLPHSFLSLSHRQTLCPPLPRHVLLICAHTALSLLLT